MTINSFFLILKRQLKEKWGRVLLSSSGIMIGVWAITLTAGLSLGLSSTIVTAINSQSAAKYFQVYKLEGGQTSFFELDGSPKFTSLSYEDDIKPLADEFDSVVETVPSEFLSFYIHSQIADSSTACVDEVAEFSSQGGFFIDDELEKSPTQRKLEEKCPTASVLSTLFTYFYEENQVNWYGQKERPSKGQIVSCFRCGSLRLDRVLGVDSPEEMIGKVITIEPSVAPDFQTPGEVIDIGSYTRDSKLITETNKWEMEIVAVVDDRDSSGVSFTGGDSNRFWFDFSYFIDAIKLSDSEVQESEIGFFEFNFYVDSYSNLTQTIEDLRDEGYTAFSLLETVISAIEVVFLVLTAVLSSFGLIAMIASLFGIVNVMTISVLERKKEIGILKSLGARNGDIFKLFFVESTILGFFGWLLGTGISFFLGFIVTFIFNYVRDNNLEIKESLASLNITGFSPVFPLWLILGTLFLSVFFTAFSGIVPAIRASRQNPVDVLRSE